MLRLHLSEGERTRLALWLEGHARPEEIAPRRWLELRAGFAEFVTSGELQVIVDLVTGYDLIPSLRGAA